jgi:hypothetical protein
MIGKYPCRRRGCANKQRNGRCSFEWFEPSPEESCLKFVSLTKILEIDDCNDCKFSRREPPSTAWDTGEGNPYSRGTFICAHPSRKIRAPIQHYWYNPRRPKILGDCPLPKNLEEAKQAAVLAERERCIQLVTEKFQGIINGAGSIIPRIAVRVRLDEILEILREDGE